MPSRRPASVRIIEHGDHHLDVGAAGSGTAVRFVGGAVVVLAVAATVLMVSVPLSGDEGKYVRDAAAIGGDLRGWPGREATADGIVGAGWFMPGMSLALVPLFLVSPDAGVVAVRVYAACLVLGALAWTVRELRHRLDERAALLLLVFPATAPTWLVFASTAWGDVLAGLVVVVALVQLHRVAVDVVTGEAFRRRLLATEVLLLVALYLRASTLVVLVAANALVVVLVLVSRRGTAAVGRGLASVAIGGLVVVAGLAPWSVTASTTLGGPVVTTTSLPLSLAIHFGDPDQLCLGVPCEATTSAGLWAEALELSRTTAARRGVSELEVQSEMATGALAGLTVGDYLGDVAGNVRRYVTPTPEFPERFLSLSTHDLGDPRVELVARLVAAATAVLLAPFLAALAVANLVVVRRDLSMQCLSLVLKVATAALFVQPFVHRTHSRYWLVLAPTAALAAWFLLARRTAPAVAADAPTPGTDPGRGLVTLQRVHAGGVVALAVVLVVAA